MSPSGPIFIACGSHDRDLAEALYVALEAYDLPAWIRSLSLPAGSALGPEITRAIDRARAFVVILSAQSINSRWLRREIKHALRKEQEVDYFRIVVLRQRDVKPSALEMWFDDDRPSIAIAPETGGLSKALPAILTALGEAPPGDLDTDAQAGGVDDLILTLTDPHFLTRNGARHVTATASLDYAPADPAKLRVSCQRFHLAAPIGPIELGELQWYLERYWMWPTGVFARRAAQIESALADWGKRLFTAALGSDVARQVLLRWLDVGDEHERRFCIEIDHTLPDGASEEAQANAREAAAGFFALPWELLHDGDEWLFMGRQAVRVCRRVPNRLISRMRPAGLPIRILAVSPRPQRAPNGGAVPYIDHRVSIRALLDAMEHLGGLVQLTVLAPPTAAALEQALETAQRDAEPYDVVHFDGHGVYDADANAGYLLFESPRDVERSRERRAELVDALRFSTLVRDHGVPLVFLDACKSMDADPRGAIPALLVQGGVSSLVTMSHMVLTETTRRFVTAFYRSIAEGARVSRAMLVGQRALYEDSMRGTIAGAGELHLRDWFVPLLYQTDQDTQLIAQVPAAQLRRLASRKRQLDLGELPEEPSHGFRGRSDELLEIERLLSMQPWVVVRGAGGTGKTILACELARWLVRTGRFSRAAFVDLERPIGASALTEVLGRQLVGEAEVGRLPDVVWGQIEEGAANQPAIIVVDNCESVLARRDENGAPPMASDAGAEIFRLCHRLSEAAPSTRVVFTSRERLPEPFDRASRELLLGTLSRPDAIQLVNAVMKEQGWKTAGDLAGETPEDVTNLVMAVNCHPLTLVLVGREAARRGVRDAANELTSLMAALDRRYPGDRENSLYASVALSLKRLRPESRRSLDALAFCHGGVHLAVLRALNDLSEDAAREIAVDLIEVGLAQGEAHGHLRLNPALPSYLLRELNEADADALRERWVEVMTHFTAALARERQQNPEMVAQLTLLELPNLLAMLEHVHQHEPPEVVLQLTRTVELLAGKLGRSEALARLVEIGEQASRLLEGWTHARCAAECDRIERALGRSEFARARDLAEVVVQRCREAGDDAYPGAPHDVARALWYLGRARGALGESAEALPALEDAHRRYIALADGGDPRALSMVSATSDELGDCLRALGRFPQAEEAYREAIDCAERSGDLRQSAVARFDLGTLAMMQGDLATATRIFDDVREMFLRLNEPRSVATACHQVGVAYEAAGQFDRAEHAFREALAIRAQLGETASQASTLGQLGRLYHKMGRDEESVELYRQAAEAFRAMNALADERRARGNLANALIALGRYEEAREEHSRAMAVSHGLGHTSEPWLDWAILENIERAAGRTDAARTARQEAIAAYLAYRRDGGESRSERFPLFETIARAIRGRQTREAAKMLGQLPTSAELPPFARALIAKLTAVLAGDRNPAMISDPELDFCDAAELHLLLESLQKS